MLDGIVTHPASSAIIPNTKTPFLIFKLESSFFGASILACREALGNGQDLKTWLPSVNWHAGRHRKERRTGIAGMRISSRTTLSRLEML